MAYIAIAYVDGSSDNDCRHDKINDSSRSFRTIAIALQELSKFTTLDSEQRCLVVIGPGKYNEKFLNFINIDVQTMGEVCINLDAIGKVSSSNLMEDSGVIFY